LWPRSSWVIFPWGAIDAPHRGNGILVDFRQAVQEGTAVHVSGALTSGGQTVTLDLYLNKGANSSGTVGASGATVPFRSIGGSNTGIGFAVAKGTTTLNGQPVAVYTDSENAGIYFPATGFAYLIEITSGTNTLTFTWNQPTKVAAPPSADIFGG
jgi:hypothetical protein